MTGQKKYVLVSVLGRNSIERTIDRRLGRSTEQKGRIGDNSTKIFFIYLWESFNFRIKVNYENGQSTPKAYEALTRYDTAYYLLLLFGSIKLEIHKTSSLRMET